MDPLKSQKLNREIRKRREGKLLWLLFINIIFITCCTAISIVYGPLIYHEIRYSFATLYDDNVKNSGRLAKDLPIKAKNGEDILLKPIVTIPEPKDKNFSIIIPKIDLNKKVISNVNLSDENDVKNALSQGVGWAKGTVEPGQYGNSLIFAHSTRNVWDILRYNSEFSLLDKLQVDDMFSIVYDERQYDFIVFEKKVVPANDTSYLTSVADGRVVTLQTCYPPGSDSGRLLVRGRLVAMETK